MLRSRWSSCVVLLVGCGPPLLGDAATTSSIEGDGDGDDANATQTSSETGEPAPGSSAVDDDGGTLRPDAGSGSEGAPQLDAGSDDRVCTDTACFGPAHSIDQAPASSIAIADLDADGVGEVIAGNDDGLRILSSTGEVTAIATVGRVVAIASGKLDADEFGDVAAITDAARLVFVHGGVSPTATSLVASDGLTDVAIADGTSAELVTSARDGTVTLWRSANEGWVPSFLAVGGQPSTVAIAPFLDQPTLLVATGDHQHGRLDALAIDGDVVTASSAYPYFDDQPVQLEANRLFDELPDLLVLGDAPPALEILRSAGEVADYQATDVLALAGRPTAFAIGTLGYGERDLAIVDAQAGIVELCALVVAGDYAPQCKGAVIAVGPNPVAIAIGELDGTAPDDLAIASPDTGITLVPGLLVGG